MQVMTGVVLTRGFQIGKAGEKLVHGGCLGEHPKPALPVDRMARNPNLNVIALTRISPSRISLFGKQ
jgi:hypothetical protein